MGSACSPSWMTSTSCVTSSGERDLWALQHALFAHSSIRVHNGKTQVWNRGGVIPAGMEVLQAVARATLTLSCGEEIPRCTTRSKACGFWALRWATRSSYFPSWRVCLRRTIS